jgi:5'-deoxynucleotidase YfbR-like HD superfamily hydrolase
MTYDLYQTGFTVRYHGNARMAHLGQTNGHHQWGVTVLLFKLFGDRIDNLAVVWEALHHDTGESGAADVSYPAKQKYPDLAEAAAEAEYEERRSMGVSEAVLTETETAMLKFCDRLESFLFASIRAPHVLADDDWQDLKVWLENQSFALDVAAEVRALLREVGY